MCVFVAGRKEGLVWLLECLRETRQDRLDGDDGAGDEAIPLLPLSDSSIDAMEDHNFLNFIAKLGLAPPSNEQVRSINQSLTNPSSKFQTKNTRHSFHYFGTGTILAHP